MIALSKYFKGAKPLFAHLVRPTTGLSGEIWNLLKRIEAAFLLLQADMTLTTQTSKVWAYQTNTVSAEYIGGFYDFGVSDNDFSPPVSFGVAAKSVAAHLFIVTGAIPVGDVTIRVTGNSINDEGTRVVGDTEDITILSGTAVNTYFEFKKFNGQVDIETVAGTPITCNYGFAKYHDFNNQDFDVTGIEALWLSDANDSASDIELLHHKATGWLFNAAAPPTPPTP